MRKRILALLCMLAVLAGVLTVGASASQENDRYLVGYAKRDINPWKDPENKVYDVNAPETCLIGVPLSGYANSSERPATDMIDDNGDGVIDNNDGLQVTCTSVTDAWGKTVLYLTVDAISGYGGTTKDLRAAIVAELGGDVISAPQIMLSGSHSHYAADLDSCRASAKDSELYKYYEYALSQMVAAAVEAYNSRTEAVMTKGQIDASESSGYQLNYVRHYNVEEQRKTNGVWKVTNSYVSGSNFGGSKTATTTSALIRTVENVSESNDTMYLLRFSPVNGDAPIVILNWRAHPCLTPGGSTDGSVSSDYINSFRYYLEKAGYRAAFIQGAAGNINARRVSDSMTPWCSYKVSADILPNSSLSCIYGYLLSQVALDCMENNMTDELEPGRIRTRQLSYSAAAQIDSEGLVAAADAYYAEVAAGKTVSFPYRYLHTDGKFYILNSKYHASNITNRRNNTASTRVSYELNAIMLGNSVAMVTSPCEMFDRYSAGATLTNTTANDWLDLIDEETYGTPFVLAYTNGHSGYMPNSLAYTYNENSSTYGKGSYEANTTRAAQGEGEKIIAAYGTMLELVGKNYRVSECEHCGEVVEWSAITADQSGNQYFGSGHYYLAEDLPLQGAAQKMILDGETLCLDLNGHSIQIKGRSFNLSGTSTLSLMDTAGGGSVTSYSGNNNVGGGVITMSGSKCTVNLYGGTLQFVRSEEGINPGYETAKGGVISCTGTVNMYGGTVIGGQLGVAGNSASGSPLIGTDNGYGASVYLHSGGKLNVYGGSIKAGSAAPGCYGDCVYVAGTSSRIVLSGDAVVDEICYGARSSATLTIKDTYTGSAAIGYDPDKVTFTDRLDIGNLSGADITGATLTCSTDPGARIVGSGSNILVSLYDSDTVAAIHDSQGTRRFTALQDAINAYSGGYIRLLEDQTESVTVDRDIEIDLYGYDMIADVAQDATLCVWDTRTDDYKVADSYGYGKLTLNSGVARAAENYVMLEDDGTQSFHRYALELTAMNLRPGEAGMYYLSSFSGDELVAEHVTRFGVILSVWEEPTEQNLSQCRWSAVTDFISGKNKNTDVAGTLLKNILKPTNLAVTNQYHSQLPVYGRPYILLDNGQYLFGDCVSRSLRTQVERADALWTSLDETQTAAMLTMYETYPELMNSWNIPNLLAALEAGETTESTQ